MDNKKKVLAYYLELDDRDSSKIIVKDNIYEYNTEEYIIFDNCDEVEKAIKNKIRQSLKKDYKTITNNCMFADSIKRYLVHREKHMIDVYIYPDIIEEKKQSHVLVGNRFGEDQYKFDGETYYIYRIN